MVHGRPVYEGSSMSVPVHIVGIVASDPKLVTFANDLRRCSFRLGSTQRRYDRTSQEWVDGETTWLTVNLFHGIAENAAASFAKGDRVLVAGRLRVRQWEADGRTGTSVDIEADAIGHDLRWGTSAFTKRRFTNKRAQETSQVAEESDTPGTKWNTPPGVDEHGERNAVPF